MGAACCSDDKGSQEVEVPLATVAHTSACEVLPADVKETSVQEAAAEEMPATTMGETVEGVVTVTFRDQDSGKETEFTLTEAPFGMRYETGLMPVVIKEFLPNSHAQSVGVPLETPLVKVNGVALEQMQADEDEDAMKAKFAKIDKAVRHAAAAAFGVAMTFRDPADGKETSITLRQVPFGMSYTTGVSPVVMREFVAGSYAKKCGAPLNVPLVRINGIDLEGASFGVVDRAIKDAAKALMK